MEIEILKYLWKNKNMTMAWWEAVADPMKIFAWVCCSLQWRGWTKFLICSREKTLNYIYIYNIISEQQMPDFVADYWEYFRHLTCFLGSLIDSSSPTVDHLFRILLDCHNGSHHKRRQLTVSSHQSALIEYKLAETRHTWKQQNILLIANFSSQYLAQQGPFLANLPNIGHSAY